MSKIKSLFGGDDSAEKAAEEERRRQQEREAAIARGLGDIRGTLAGTFNPDFYRGIEEAYTEFALPQLEEQFADQMKALTANLSAANLLDSSVRAEKMADLQRQRERAEADIRNRALELSRGRRGDVARIESELVSQLHSTADPALAASGASAAVQRLGSLPRFEMLNQVIDDVAGTVGDVQAARQRTTTPRVRFPTGGTGAGSVFVS